MENRQAKVRIKSTGRPRSAWEGVLVGLLGAVLGMLFSCCLGMIAVSFLGGDPEATPTTSPPRDYAVETIVEEHYINRALSEGTAGSRVPELLAAGHVDVRPNNLIDFTIQLAFGPLRPLVRGTAALRVTEAGELRVTLEKLDAGRLSLASLVPDRVLTSLNEEINRQLVERTTAMGVRLLGISSDETTLHLYLVSDS